MSENLPMFRPDEYEYRTMKLDHSFVLDGFLGFGLMECNGFAFAFA